MFLPRHRIEAKSHNIKISDRTFENVSQLKYFVTAVTNQNFIQEEIKNRLDSDSA
jgi:hypothetical protein